MGLNKLRTFSVALGLQNLDTPSLRGSMVNIRNDTGDRDRESRIRDQPRVSASDEETMHVDRNDKTV